MEEKSKEPLDKKKLEDVFPFEYMGGGFFRRKGIAKGVTAEVLHGMEAVEYIFKAMSLDGK